VGDARGDDALCGQEDQCTNAGWDQVESARLKAIIGDVSVGVGIAAIGVGAYLLLTNQKEAPTRVGVRHIVPSADRNGGYLTVRGAF
jgi:hypothetical protein